MTIQQRIRDLREDADKTQTEVARYLGTTAQYYGQYEKGEREMPISRAIMLADYYHVSLDYLVGRTDIKSVEAERNKDLQFASEVKRSYQKIYEEN